MTIDNNSKEVAIAFGKFLEKNVKIGVTGCWMKEGKESSVYLNINTWFKEYELHREKLAKELENG